MISCCAEAASAYLLTQNTISNPKRFPVFSVVFQRRIPKCISLMLILCFEHAKVCEYFSVLLRSSVVFARFSDSDSLRFKLWVRLSRCTLPIFLLCPWSSQFSIFSLIKQFLCWGLEGIMKSSLTKERSDWQPKFFFPPQSILLLPLFSHTSSHSASATLLSLSFIIFFSHCHIEPSLLSSPFILSSLWSLLSLDLSCSLSSIFLLLWLCPSRTIYQEWHPFTFLPVSSQHRF